MHVHHQIGMGFVLGSCVVTSIWVEWGIPCAPPVDILIFPWMDILNPMFMYLVLGLILEHRFWFVWLAPPCSSFSWACNRFLSTCMRSISFPNGLPTLSTASQEKVTMGNALRDAATTLARTQHSVGETHAAEQPGTSLMLGTPEFTEMEEDTGAVRAYRDQCQDGAPWKKFTAVSSNDPAVLEAERLCNGGHEHLILEGRDASGIPLTKLASSYWPEFARSVLRPLCRRAPPKTERLQVSADWRAGLGTDVEGLSVVRILERLHQRPSGGRHAASRRHHHLWDPALAPRHPSVGPGLRESRSPHANGAAGQTSFRTPAISPPGH